MTDLINAFLGQYQLVELIRRGGMSTVYKAYQPSLDRYVAIKVLQHTDDPQFASRFKREARAIAQLQHPNILPIYDYNEQEGLLYLVLQYIENGVTLTDMLGQPLAVPDALHLTEHVLDALEYAHNRGIIHRDIKPPNILMSSPRWPMLADFGIAKLINDRQRLTMPGLIIGTPAYITPEQATGRPIDARTDLYSLGAVLYEMLTGHVPFDAPTPLVVLSKHVYEQPVPLHHLNPAVPPAVESVVLRALAKDPEDRYQHASEMRRAIQEVLSQLEHENRRTLTSELYQSGVQAFEAGEWALAMERLSRLVTIDPQFEKAASLLEAARSAQIADAHPSLGSPAKPHAEPLEQEFEPLPHQQPSPHTYSGNPPINGKADTASAWNDVKSRFGQWPSPAEASPAESVPDTSGHDDRPATATAGSQPATGAPGRSEPNSHKVVHHAPFPKPGTADSSSGSSDTVGRDTTDRRSVPPLAGPSTIGASPAPGSAVSPAAPRRRGAFVVLCLVASVALLAVIYLSGIWTSLAPVAGSGDELATVGDEGAPSPVAQLSVPPDAEGSAGPSAGGADVSPEPGGGAVPGEATPSSPPDTPALTPPVGSLVYEDDFSQGIAESGLEDRLPDTIFSRGVHPPGVYQIKLAPPNTTRWELFPRFIVRNFSLQIDLWDNSDTFQGNVTHGVVFGAQDDKHFYTVLLNTRLGQYAVGKFDGSQDQQDLLPWKESPLIRRQAEVNQLRVDAADDGFTIYLNGQLLDTVDEDAYQEGMIGMIVANEDADQPHVHFDNIAVWSSDPPPSSSDLPAERTTETGAMVLIPGGPFILGSNERDAERPHIVAVQDFYLDQTEVTNAAYRSCVAAEHCAPPYSPASQTHPDYANQPEYDLYPVIHITWQQAHAFCEWAGKRLPTEAEWEKAASWKTPTRQKFVWAWGNTFDSARVNAAETQTGDTTAVRQYPAEMNGTYGMAGNVYEWTNSLYRPYPYDATDGREDSAAAGERVFRGGSWAQTQGKARNVTRQAAAPDYRDREIGFRCAMSP